MIEEYYEILIPEEEYWQDIILNDYMAKAEFKVKYVWRIHKNDLDNWPSKPHCHNYENKIKLDVYSGIIFSAITRNAVEKLREKELRIVQKKLLEFGFVLDQAKADEWSK